MDELHIVSGVQTLGEFERLWHDLSKQGWEFVSTLNFEDTNQVLIFKRPDTGLGETGVL